MNNRCSVCGSELNGNVEFCPSCGNKVEKSVQKKFCLYCGKEIDAGIKFCPSCGANFETGERGNNSNNGSSSINTQFSTSEDSSVTTAFVFSILGLLCCAIFAIPGLIKANDCLSLIAAGKISQDKRGLANAAKIISIVALVLWAINILFLFMDKGSNISQWYA